MFGLNLLAWNLFGWNLFGRDTPQTRSAPQSKICTAIKFLHRSTKFSSTQILGIKSIAIAERLSIAAIGTCCSAVAYFRKARFVGQAWMVRPEGSRSSRPDRGVALSGLRNKLATRLCDRCNTTSNMTSNDMISFFLAH